MQKKRAIVLLFLILSIGGIHMNAYSQESKILKITGIIAKSIEIACNAFEDKLDVKWENYVTKIEESDLYIVVNFSSKDMPVARRGSAKGIPGFEVKILKSNFEIIESQFIR